MEMCSILFTKKRARWILWSLPILVLSGALCWKVHQPEYVLRQFSGLQKSRLAETPDSAEAHLKALKNWQKTKIWPSEIWHRTYLNWPARPQKPLLFSMSFYHHEHSLLELDIDETKRYSFLSPAGVGPFEWETKPITEATVEKLNALLTQFPQCASPAPNWENVLFVSYRAHDVWQARVYDRRRLPTAMSQVVRLLSNETGENLAIEKPESSD